MDRDVRGNYKLKSRSELEGTFRSIDKILRPFALAPPVFLSPYKLRATFG